MAEQHARKSRQRETEDDDSASSGQPEKDKQTNDVSAATEDMLDDIDRALKSQCGFDEDENVSDEAFTVRADQFVKNYQQKPGQ
jgi:hypothetical protein